MRKKGVCVRSERECEDGGVRMECEGGGVRMEG